MKFLKLFIIFIFISNCTLNKVVKHHGVHNLKKKNVKLELLNSNTNDVISQLGSPSTKGSFDSDVWIYVERKITSSELKTLGKRKLLVNDVLILEFNNKGLLVKKDFISIDDMNELEITKYKTSTIDKKNSLIFTFLSSLRQKINDPMGVKKAK
jgi:outer membrane protein assembly factor BamE (lipoprotein component of BamABCDE complex)|tara:strand:+ start:265 stop:726 length:462 start_codon:yes stop_codon:yes gene_type:complete